MSVTGSRKDVFFGCSGTPSNSTSLPVNDCLHSVEVFVRDITASKFRFNTPARTLASCASSIGIAVVSQNGIGKSGGVFRLYTNATAGPSQQIPGFASHINGRDRRTTGCHDCKELAGYRFGSKTAP
jgi:hypothetical protein